MRRSNNDNDEEVKREKICCEKKHKKSNLENERHNYIVKCKTLYKLLGDSKSAILLI